ncbi:Protein of unknown function [bacterium A37T11]|nr:Protein of unknown function [bacterium A37T11]
MRQTYLFALFLPILLSTGVMAQQDSLSGLRQAPPKDPLEVKAPELSIKEVIIRDENLNLQVDYWRNWTKFGINANQASFNDNWQGGGVNFLGIGLAFNTKFDYTKENKNFTSELDLKYGKQKNKDQLARKSNDRIFWDNKFSVNFTKQWSFFASLAFESQFDKGYTYKTGSEGQDTLDRFISSFLAPGYLTESVGIEVKPDPTWSIRFGTGTARQTLVLNDNVLRPDTVKIRTDPNYLPNYQRFGINWPGTFRNELAFQLVSTLNRNLSANININARYAFFANYQDLKNASHRVDATLTAKVSRVLSVTLVGVLLYDPLQDPGIQTSQTTGIGIQYNFPR